MNILVTGGAGYIGTHTLIELVNNGHTPVVVDSLVNSSHEALRRVEKIVGKDIEFHTFDVCDREKLSEIFKSHQFDAVVHFAGLKAVGESVKKPLLYYRNNLVSTLTLCEVMQENNVKNLVFSSSATVYGLPEELPLKETSRVGLGITNPYGQTKYMIEKILTDLAAADPTWNITLLRYFNPIGADKSGTIGEDPGGVPANIFPYITQVAVGKRDKLSIFGGDYDTPDGTGIRDYIHVVDLARGHIAALEHMKPGAEAYNLCTGNGVSVLELVKAFESVSGKSIPYEIVDRRPGDIASCYADGSKAQRELGWATEKTLADACADAWKWQSQNPDGFNT